MAGSTDAMEHAIFVPGIGQYENIGDLILRRQLLRWVRPIGRLHIFIGHAPPGYAEGLALTDEDRIYRSFSAWYQAGLSSALRQPTSYLFKPGEIQLTLKGLKEHVAMLPLAWLIRLRGGHVARVGAGSRNFAALPRLLMLPSISVAQRVWWRDLATARYLGGSVMPDLAFGEGDDIESIDQSIATRDTLVVSMRGDRSDVPKNWIDGVRLYSQRSKLRVMAVTQVLRDASLARTLAQELDGDCVDWDGFNHHQKEIEINKVYRRAALVVSDRLHVLIAAYTHGAAPIALQTDRSDKIDRHFAAIDVRGVTSYCQDQSPEQIADILAKAASRRSSVLAALPGARAQLDSVRKELIHLLLTSRRPATATDHR